MPITVEVEFEESDKDLPTNKSELQFALVLLADYIDWETNVHQIE